MRGIVIDEKSRAVKAAIVKIIKIQESEEENEEEAVTYARTDENGRFVVRDLNPEEEYVVEIRLEEQTDSVDENTENTQDEDLKETITEETKEIKIIISQEEEVNKDTSDYVKPNHDFRNKLYQIRNSTWW